MRDLDRNLTKATTTTLAFISGDLDVKSKVLLTLWQIEARQHENNKRCRIRCRFEFYPD